MPEGCDAKGPYIVGPSRWLRGCAMAHASSSQQPGPLRGMGHVVPMGFWRGAGLRAMASRRSTRGVTQPQSGALPLKGRPHPWVVASWTIYTVNTNYLMAKAKSCPLRFGSLLGLALCHFLNRTHTFCECGD